MKSFIDVAQIYVKAGNGGDGRVSFRREKYIPKGGPDGGNGGDGGNVWIRTSSQLNTLYDFTHKRRFVALDGAIGGDNNKTGKSADDITLEVPVGTVVYELKDGDTPESRLEKIVDLKDDGAVYLLAKGGKGGRGNTSFKSATHQTPREFEPGGPGAEREVVLELKMVADVGLVGFPNAGKSTLLAHLTAARPAIADYPFTTLSPNLGVMEYYDRKVVLADIPGIIEGASEGKGLGDEFLRHIERTRILVHIIDPIYSDPVAAYKTIRDELGAYSKKLLNKAEIVVINKTDVTEVKRDLDMIKKRFRDELGLSILGISAVSGEGIDEIKKGMVTTLGRIPTDVEEESTQEEKPVVFHIDDLKHAKI